MLYDGAIRFLRFACKSLEKRDIAAKGTYISKVLAIIAELDCALDHHLQKELAENLSGLYQYMLIRLSHANCHNDPGALEEVIALLHDLQEAFSTAIEQQRLAVSVVDEQRMPQIERVDIAV